MTEEGAAVGSRYPRLERYIAQLPNGLDSFPECEIKASVFRTVLEFSDVALVGLPAPLQQLIEDPPPHNSWVPQCQGLALIIASVEAQQLAGDGEGAWIQAAAAKIFQSSMYRILMKVASPRILFKGSGMRWSAFFRGTSLAPVLGERVADIVLECPEPMFTLDLATIFEDVFRAATNFTDENTGLLNLDTFSPGAVVYRGAW